jgi:hypothetical protein
MMYCAGCANRCHASCLAAPQWDLPRRAWVCTACISGLGVPGLPRWSPGGAGSRPSRTCHRSFIIRQIINHKKVAGVPAYMVSWRGYGERADSWVTEPELQADAPQELMRYKQWRADYNKKVELWKAKRKDRAERRGPVRRRVRVRRRRRRRCGGCNKTGHDIRRCITISTHTNPAPAVSTDSSSGTEVEVIAATITPLLSKAATVGRTRRKAPRKVSASGKMRRCSVCRLVGHNARTCPDKAVAPTSGPRQAKMHCLVRIDRIGRKTQPSRQGIG